MMIRRGYTLVEMMIATVLTLVIMAAVVATFGSIGDAVINARAGLEMNEELRGAASLLKADLEGVTVKVAPPVSPETNSGYLEITEPARVLTPPTVTPPGVPCPGPSAPCDNESATLDTTVTNRDLLMFTTRRSGAPFIGRYGVGTLQSQEAEVAWFVRGRTLYRRVLLVSPNTTVAGDGTGFYQNNDISVRRVSGLVVANSLGDLTKPENRFAHQSPHCDASNVWNLGNPYHPYFCFRSQSGVPPLVVKPTPWLYLGLPTLAECAATGPPSPPAPTPPVEWIAGGWMRTKNVALAAPGAGDNTWPDNLTPSAQPFDAWTTLNPTYPWNEISSVGSLTVYHDPNNANQQSTRLNEDVVLNNVIGFDVRVWDPRAPLFAVPPDNTIVAPGDPGYSGPLALYVANPAANPAVGYGAYVDLNYATGAGVSDFSSVPQGTLGAGSAPLIACVYDTWSTHYEDGMNINNGFDDNTDGVIDDPSEANFPPPYSAPVRGIQVKIRVFEPGSRQIREVTLVQEFVSK